MPTLQTPILGDSHGIALLPESRGEAGKGETSTAKNELPEVQGAGELHGLAQMGTIASPEEVRLHELGEATRKGNVPLLNDFLGRIVTLDTALIGGGFAAAKLDALPIWSCLTLVVLLLASLLIGMDGLRPRGHKIDTSLYLEIERIERITLARKNSELKISASLFVAAILVAVLGFFVKLL